MTREELDTIEENLRKVDKVTPGSYGIVTALELAAELRKLLSPAVPAGSGRNQSRAEEIVESLFSPCT